METVNSNNNRRSEPTSIGAILSPLLEIIAHPDRNNLIKEFFAAAERNEIYTPPKQKRAYKRRYTNASRHQRQSQIF